MELVYMTPEFVTGSRPLRATLCRFRFPGTQIYASALPPIAAQKNRSGYDPLSQKKSHADFAA